MKQLSVLLMAGFLTVPLTSCVGADRDGSGDSAAASAGASSQPQSAPPAESTASGASSTTFTSTPSQLELDTAEAQRFGVTVAELQAAKKLVPADQRGQVASMMMVGVANYDDALWALNQGVGGIFIGSWTDPSLLAPAGRNLQLLKQTVSRPFAVSIDAEGGRVQRQPALFGQVPSPREMGSFMTPEQTYQQGLQLGVGLNKAGVTVDFAPVLDLDGGPAGGAIGDRSFSADPKVATESAAQFANGLRAAKVRPVYKHFPGHGRTTGDSHFQDVTTPPWSELQNYDLLPYGPALEKAPGDVMIGHMQVPGLGQPLPASINPAVYAALRNGHYVGGRPFTGLIYTDDLSGMKAISGKLPISEAATRALSSGADVALWISTAGLSAAIDRADAAATVGEIPAQHLYDASLRVQLAHVRPV